MISIEMISLKVLSHPPCQCIRCFHNMDMDSKHIVCNMDLDGQPEALAIFLDMNCIVIAIKNKPNKDFNNGLIPQLPASLLIVIETLHLKISRTGHCRTMALSLLICIRYCHCIMFCWNC
jgi:hypothetical protein